MCLLLTPPVSLSSLLEPLKSLDSLTYNSKETEMPLHSFYVCSSSSSPFRTHVKLGEVL